nr:methylmalonyl-CoA mutase [Deltaproteobacteria bacterium]
MAPVKKPETDLEVRTISGIPLKASYGPDDLTSRGWSYEKQLGDPGAYPFTRGPHATMYRGRPWTMRMFAGFGTPEDTNKRFKFLLENGQTGLSTAFDMPTLMGYDPDHTRSLGEVGREGVSVASLDDMMRLFGDIPLDKVSTSMTINAPAAVLLALYVAGAEKQGVSPDKLRGTLQNDMLKE